jgi:nitrate reductase / nitrite oxidoreductase, alpha subunit
MAQKHIPFADRLRYLKKGEIINDGWSEESVRPRGWEDLYRARWGHDKIVRSTHGVNCTGSCSWKVYVKDGIITWETQQTDYPSLGPDFPEYEPRGCPRGASFSWYSYSPSRVRYPYIRGDLVDYWRAARKKGTNPIEAWASIVEDDDKHKAYMAARGKGGFVRSTWEETSEIIAAASIHTISKYGPDRITGFTPIPAFSMVSYASGSRMISLMGGTMLSFYDWYADFPPASPQIWGEQTDVPESADWYNSKYFIIWGTNLPMTRTPDAHFMVESRYNGTTVIGVSPDYSEYVKFADLWLPCKAGTDAALAMSMTHVVMKEFYVDRQAPYFMEYAKKFTDLPFLVQLRPHGNEYAPDRFLRASDIGNTEEMPEWKTVMWDEERNNFAVPKGSVGYRWDKSKKWNLHLEDAEGKPIKPLLTLLDHSDDVLQVAFPYFGAGKGETALRGVPVKKVTTSSGETVYFTTVLDLMMAHVGVPRGLPGDYPVDYDDPKPYTPAWQEKITGVRRDLAIRVAREFAANAETTKGKSMIALGAGTNHWYHSDMIYRCIINLVLLCGCEGVNGGGWAHYVGQEKVRPLEGWSMLASGGDWIRPPRFQNGTNFWYFMTDQFRYETLETKTMGSPLGGRFQNIHPADMAAMAARLGWQPFYPQFLQNSLSLADDARKNGAKTNEEIEQYVAEKIKNGEIEWAVENPDDPKVFPRVFFNWRSNLLGAAAKGHEYFLSHLLGSSGHVLGDETPGWQPKDVKSGGETPHGKVDLYVSIDFRMTSSGLYSDIVLPAATWYEKYDISSTDMHPFVHPFNAAISWPWEAKDDWTAFKMIAEKFSDLAKDYLPEKDDVVVRALGHDSPTEAAQPFGKVKDWRAGECEAIPGKTMPNFVVVHRDYPHLANMLLSVGPNAKVAIVSKGITMPGEKAYEEILHKVGAVKTEGPGKGRPSLENAMQAVEFVLTFSGCTNGHRAVDGWKSLSENTGLDLSSIAEGVEEVSYTLHDLSVQPRVAMPTAVWSGIEADGRRYAPFVVNIEHDVPFRTLTGRQHFYMDHEVMLDFGEGLPLYRPPLDLAPFEANESEPDTDKARTVMIRYLTPHQKWGYHTQYTDNPRMLSLFRGMQVVWMSEEDAESIGIRDNDWIEVYNRNGVIVARAVVTYRLPQGIAMMYHAQDRIIGVPGSPITNDRAGTHNSVTRIIPKNTHMIGAYAQFSFGFNYYGTTGHNRDTLAYIRPLKEVNWLES